MRADNDDDVIYYRERERHCREMAEKAGDPAVQQIHHQFAEAYGKVTQGCNNCHTTMEHPFIVIKSPDASAWPNQDFAPAGR